MLAGPTGSGKSSLALEVAGALTGSIVCADSRQLYRGMRVASAGPRTEEEARVPHVGYHVLDPDEVYDAGRFVRDADAAIATVREAGRWPLLVGGAGLYLRAFRFGLKDVPGSDAAVRAALHAQLEEVGVQAMHRELAERDPPSAATISHNDEVRVVRALEVLAVSGRPASELRPQDWARPPRMKCHWVLLDAEMGWLEGRLHRRAQEMYAHGLVEEALALRARLGPTHPRLTVMGIEEALLLADGHLDATEALERTFRRQRRYAKRQRTWFKKEGWWTRLDAARVTASDVLGIVHAGL